MVWIVVEDLIFLSRIEETARKAGIAIRVTDPKRLPEESAHDPAAAVLIDLNHRSGLALDAVRAVKGRAVQMPGPVIGYLSHVQTELAAAARAAGCDRVMARSTLVKELPDLLGKLAEGEKGSQ